MATSPVKTQSFVSILDDYFVGRREPYVEQQEDGSYLPIYKALTWDDLEAHVNGEITVGTYTINEENKVRCVTWDIDSGNYADVMRIMASMPGPVAVFSSGRKGYHVIQSFKEPIPSELAYTWGKLVKSVAGLPDIESFPKQATLDRLKYGSLTKLPYATHRVTGKRSELVYGTIGYAPLPVLPPGVSLDNGRRPAPNGQGGGWLSKMFEGEHPDGRNNMLNRFYYWLHVERGFPEDLARLNVEWVNENCFTEPLDQEELERTVLRPR